MSPLSWQLLRTWSQKDLDTARRYARFAREASDDPVARAWWRLASIRALWAARRMHTAMLRDI